MSFKLQKRNSEEPTETNAVQADDSADKKPQKTYSVTAYVCLLFAVVVVVVLMSYFVQQRNNSEALISLREQHDQVTSQAFENIEKLQEKNMELLDENNELKDKINDLEDKIKEFKDAEDKTEAKIDALECENKAMKDLSALQTAINTDNAENAKALIDKLNEEKEFLSQEGKENFNALKAAYDNSVKTPGTEE